MFGRFHRDPSPGSYTPRRVLPTHPRESGRGRNDNLGQVLAVLALGALSLTTIPDPYWGWGSEPSLVCLGAAVVSAGLFLLVEARRQVPLLRLDLFRNHGFSGACTVAGRMTFGMYAMLFLVPLYPYAVRGAPALPAGLELLPLPLTFLWVSRRSGEMASRLGPRLMTTAGVALMGVGLLSLGGIRPHSPLGVVEADLPLLGLDLGLNTGRVMTVAMQHVPAARSETGSGVI